MNKMREECKYCHKKGHSVDTCKSLKQKRERDTNNNNKNTSKGVSGNISVREPVKMRAPKNEILNKRNNKNDNIFKSLTSEKESEWVKRAKKTINMKEELERMEKEIAFLIASKKRWADIADEEDYLVSNETSEVSSK